ncbi:MAG: histidine phosphatase family protein [Promethearchaeota archaeon]
MIKAIVIRHGETNWNDKGKVIGQSNPPLNHTGIKQAKIIAKYLTNIPITLIWTSDLIRAIKTAEFVAQAKRGILIKKTNSLREADFGTLEGKYINDLKMSGEWLERSKNQYSYIPPGGESYFSVEKRILSFLENLYKNYSITEKHLIVTHVGVLRVLQHILNNLLPKDAGNLKPDFLDLWEICYGDKYKSMKLLCNVSSSNRY